MTWRYPDRVKRSRRLWYVLVGVGGVAYLVIGVAIWLDLLTGNGMYLAYMAAGAYMGLLSLGRRFIQGQPRKAHEGYETAEDVLRGYPTSW
jgi:hypothetical protein